MMGQATSIPWTNFTSNPVFAKRKDNDKRGHACIKISEECDECYAAAWNRWRGTGLPFNAKSMEQVDVRLNEKELHWLATSKKISGKKVFIQDMSDLFLPMVLLSDWVERLFDVFRARQDVTFQLLTKWPQRMAEFLLEERETSTFVKSVTPRIAPLPNVWLGTTVGMQSRAHQRLPAMRALSRMTWTTYVSSEPRLEPINWTGWEFLDMLITGGESGPFARPYAEAWARDDLAFCREWQIKFFMKQLGGHPNRRERMDDFPADLRVREW